MCRITSGASKSRSPDASAPAHLPPPESRHRSGPRPGSAPPGCRTRRGAVRTPRPSALQPAHDLRSPPPAPAPRAAPPRQPAAASARRARRWHRVPGESSFQPPRRLEVGDEGHHLGFGGIDAGSQLRDALAQEEKFVVVLFSALGTEGRGDGIVGHGRGTGRETFGGGCRPRTLSESQPTPPAGCRIRDPGHRPSECSKSVNGRMGLANVYSGGPWRYLGDSASNRSVMKAPVVLASGARYRRDQFSQVGEVAQVQHLAR